MRSSRSEYNNLFHPLNSNLQKYIWNCSVTMTMGDVYYRVCLSAHLGAVFFPFFWIYVCLSSALSDKCSCACSYNKFECCANIMKTYSNEFNTSSKKCSILFFHVWKYVTISYLTFNLSLSSFHFRSRVACARACSLCTRHESFFFSLFIKSKSFYFLLLSVFIIFRRFTDSQWVPNLKLFFFHSFPSLA